MGKRLGVGFVGSGFIARFHIRSWLAVRDADILGVWSPNAEHAESAAALARELGVGEAKAFPALNRIVLEDDLEPIRLLVEGYEYPKSRRDDQGRIVLTRDAAQAFLDSVSVEGPPVDLSAPLERVRQGPIQSQ